MPHFFQIFTVEYYESDDGSYPVETFILAQNPKMQAKIFRSLMLLEQYGNQLREPYSKHLRDGNYELRTRQGSDITRVLYFFFVDRRIILTNGFVKKTTETPPEEIKTAMDRRKRYLERQERNNE